MRKILLFAGLFLCSFSSEAQLAKEFTVRHQSNMKGDMTFISNNIVNRTALTKSSKKPYNDVSKKAKVNDQFYMKYIDIDNDKTTFSSSSADLILGESQNRKIAFAGLYWSAIYKYEKGNLKNAKFTVDNPKREQVENIKLKLPDSKNYIDIKGEIIFDGLNKKSFSDNAPYAVFADITQHIKELSNPEGTYTVANVRATEGILSGGISAGWTIIFVYEDETQTDKFFTIYDGFVGVTSKSVDIDFTGFQALSEGNVNATLYGSALEGDFNMIDDQLFFKSENSNEFISLENSKRPGNNFFNSSITSEENYFTSRNPNSINTLGYDTFSISIKNPENSVIPNNTKKATLRLKSSGDRYFMFMTAFNINVEETEILTEEQIVSEERNEEQSSDENLSAVTKMVAEKESSDKYALSNRIYPIESDAVIIEGIDEGYYLVSNVFAVPNNAVRFTKMLNDKGIDAKFFVNPKNNYRYVYMGSRLDFEEAKELYFSDINGQYKDEMWIMTVKNQEENTLKHQSVASKVDTKTKLSDHLFVTK